MSVCLFNQQLSSQLKYFLIKYSFLTGPGPLQFPSEGQTILKLQSHVRELNLNFFLILCDLFRLCNLLFASQHGY